MREPRPPGETAPIPVRHPEDGWTIAEPAPMAKATRRALRALVRVICPPEPAPQGIEDRIELHVRRMVRYMPRAVRLGFVLAIHLLDWAPIWRLSAPRRLRALDRPRAERVLDGLGASRIPLLRLLVLGVRGAILSTYFDQDEVHQRIGYAPLPFIAERVALRRRLLGTGGADAARAAGGTR